MASGDGFDLKQFLDQQRQEGEVDSAGAFTVAADKALKKLAQFSLPFEYDWVLKVVQAVNMWEADRLIVRQTRSATSFFFQPVVQADKLTDSAIIEALTTGALGNHDPIQVLCMALRSLVDQVGLSFVLASRRDDQLGEPIFAGDDTSQLSARVRKKWTAMKADGVRLTVSHYRANESFTGRYIPSFARVERRDIGIMRHMAYNAFTSNVPIFLDGLRVTDPPQSTRVGASGYFRPLAVATMQPEQTQKGRFEVTPLPVLPLSTSLHSPLLAQPKTHPWFVLKTMEWRQLERFYPALSQRQAIRVPPERGAHQILLVRFGVIVKVLRFRNTTESSTLYLVIPVDTFRTDLTGLSVELDDRHRQSVNAVKRLAGGSLARFAQSFPHLDAKIPGSPALAPIPGENLDAGFSIFTGSLGGPLKRASEGLHSLTERVSDHWNRPVIKGRNFDRWVAVVQEDLLKLRSDAEHFEAVDSFID